MQMRFMVSLTPRPYLVKSRVCDSVIITGPLENLATGFSKTSVPSEATLKNLPALETSYILLKAPIFSGVIPRFARAYSAVVAPVPPCSISKTSFRHSVNVVKIVCKSFVLFKKLDKINASFSY